MFEYGRISPHSSKSDPSKISNIFQPNNFYFDGSEAVSLSKLPIV